MSTRSTPCRGASVRDFPLSVASRLRVWLDDPRHDPAVLADLAVALVLLFSKPGTRRLLWWTLAALAIAGMAWSRTYLQLHWLSDTLAGALLGIGIALLSFATVQISAQRSKPHPH
jgi:hypothetical protein